MTRTGLQLSSVCCLLAATLLLCAADDGHDTTYPEEGPSNSVHRLVVARLRQRAGGGAHREGEWGAWAPWSPCSRSCGGGVATQARDCVARKRSRGSKRLDGAKRCVGRYKRFQLCNVEVCPGLPQDFRRQQCESYNRTPFNDRTYAWEPYYESLSSCALDCRAVGLSFYATLNQTVVDGTPCGAPQARKICVAGKCMSVGCDGILGSGHREDQCGVCGGDNTTCRLVEDVFDRTGLPRGYSLVLTLPTGAANVSVQQTAPSANHLALREPGGDYLLQGGRLGNGSVVRLVEAAGATFGYAPQDNFVGDSLTARGPLLHPLDVLVFSEAPNPGVRYRYQLPPRAGAPKPLHPRLTGNPLNPFVPGARTPPLTGPVNDARSVGVADSLIRERQKQREKKKEEKEKKARKNKGRRRNQEPKKKNNGHKHGPYEWKVAGFTPCSKTCGGGVQATHVTCVRKKRSTEVPEQNCYAVQRPAPQTVRCNLKPCPAQWGADEWEPCSVTCGLGVQTRRLTCRQKVSDDTDIVVPDSACTELATLPRAQVCERSPCDSGPQWEVGSWGSCSTQCGLGTRSRRVTCMAAGSNIPHHHCTDTRPSDQEICDMGSCAVDTWFFSNWEYQCSADCGAGYEKRRVYCNGDPVEDKPNCNVANKPNDTRACNTNRGCGGQWFEGPWSPCDARCGGSGQQHRSVLCVTWGRRKYRIANDDAPCRTQPKPDALKVCSKPCEPHWFTSEWSQCSVSCGGGVQRREVKCLDDQQRPSLLCATATKPDTRQSCGTQHCHTGRGSSPGSGPETLTRLEPLERSRGGRERGPHYSVRADEATSLGEESNSIRDEEDDNNVVLAASQPRPARVPPPSGWCMDRMKNCNLVYKARLCRLKYYSKLCCSTCSPDALGG